MSASDAMDAVLAVVGVFAPLLVVAFSVSMVVRLGWFVVGAMRRGVR